MDWSKGLSEAAVSAALSDSKLEDQYIHANVERFARKYFEILSPIVKQGLSQPGPKAILIYGLINAKSYQVARAQAEKLHEDDSNQFPYLPGSFAHMKPLRPEYRSGMVKTIDLINQKLESWISVWSQSHANSMFRVFYSDAMATMDFSNVENLHPVDGWHLSPLGHGRVSKAATHGAEPALDYLLQSK